MLRYRLWLPLSLVVLFGVIAAAQQRGIPGEEFVGTWSGTWDGAGSGGFELTLERIDDTLTGRVSVTGEPTYKATFKALTFDGTKMTAKYDFPPDDAAEVILNGSFEGARASGTWSVREKASQSDVATGTWTVTKK